jgi:hypothetical protein
MIATVERPARFLQASGGHRRESARGGCAQQYGRRIDATFTSMHAPPAANVPRLSC